MAVAILRPSAQGYLDNWKLGAGASKWQALASHDGDTSYAYIDNAIDGTSDYYEVPSATVPPGSTIHAVVIIIVCKEVASTYMAMAMRIGGSNYQPNTGSSQNISNVYREWLAGWTKNPRSGAAWTVDDVNGIGANAIQEIGCTAGSVGAGDQTNVTEFRAEVYFDPPGVRAGVGNMSGNMQG